MQSPEIICCVRSIRCAVLALIDQIKLTEVKPFEVIKAAISLLKAYLLPKRVLIQTELVSVLIEGYVVIVSIFIEIFRVEVLSNVKRE